MKHLSAYNEKSFLLLLLLDEKLGTHIPNKRQHTQSFTGVDIDAHNRKKGERERDGARR